MRQLLSLQRKIGKSKLPIHTRRQSVLEYEYQYQPSRILINLLHPFTKLKNADEESFKSFYKPTWVCKKERELLKLILKNCTLDRWKDIKIDLDLLHNIVAPNTFDMEPLAKAYREPDNFGFVQMDALQFLLRGNMGNVHSCHSLTGTHRPGGNLNYLASPYWISLGIYSGGYRNESQCRIRTNIEGIDDIDYANQPYTDICNYIAESLPNLVSSVNLCFGYMNNYGTYYPAVYISRIYGDRNSQSIYRLIEFIHHQFPELSICMRKQNLFNNESIWAIHGPDLPETLRGYKGMHKKLNQQVMFFTPEYNPQVLVKYKDKQYLPARYDDIEINRQIQNRSVEILDAIIVKEGPSLYHIDNGFTSYMFDNVINAQESYSPRVSFTKITNDICCRCGGGKTAMLSESFQRQHLPFYSTGGTKYDYDYMCPNCWQNYTEVSDEGLFVEVPSSGVYTDYKKISASVPNHEKYSRFTLKVSHITFNLLGDLITDKGKLRFNTDNFTQKLEERLSPCYVRDEIRRVYTAWLFSVPTTPSMTKADDTVYIEYDVNDLEPRVANSFAQPILAESEPELVPAPAGII